MKTMLLAIGNAGSNILETIRRETKHSALKDAQYVFADCDATDLSKHDADGCPSILLDSENESFPTDIFADIEKLVIVSGMGGKTGTKFTELAATSAKESGIDSVKVVATFPFIFEGETALNMPCQQPDVLQKSAV